MNSHSNACVLGTAAPFPYVLLHVFYLVELILYLIVSFFMNLPMSTCLCVCVCARVWMFAFGFNRICVFFLFFGFCLPLPVCVTVCLSVDFVNRLLFYLLVLITLASVTEIYIFIPFLAKNHQNLKFFYSHRVTADICLLCSCVLFILTLLLLHHLLFRLFFLIFLSLSHYWYFVQDFDFGIETK